MLFMCQVGSRVMAIVVQVSDMTLGLKLLLSVLFSVEMMGNGHCILKMMFVPTILSSRYN